MSLINEALKKAQKQRAHEPTLVLPSGTPPAPPPRVIKRSQPMAAQKLVTLGLICVGCLVLAGGGAWFFLRTPAPETVVSSKPKAVTPVDVTPVAVHPATGPDGPGTPAPGSSTLANAPASASAAATTVAGTPPTPAVSTSPAPSIATSAGSHAIPATAVATTPVPTAAPSSAIVAAQEPSLPDYVPTPTPKPLPKPHVLALVDGFKVAGIRASASDPKVLMNDRVFRVNDVVERNYGLRLVEINPDRIIFRDEAGATYTKSF